MENRNEMSREQLELQARISQKRIDLIQKVLASGVQAPINNEMATETAEVITRLYDTSLSDADISSCIGILEMLLSVESLPSLLHLMKSQGYNFPLREQAAQAIAVIGSSYVEKELKDFRVSASPELSRLVDIALKKSVP
jgi:hypothetical protein